MDELESQDFTLEDILKEFGETPVEEEEITTEPEELPVWEAKPKTQSAPVQEYSSVVSGDTIRIDTTQFTRGTVRIAQPVEEEEPPAPQEKTEPYSATWEPEYEQPIAEYVPAKPIQFHSRSRIRELKRKLVAGPEKQYYILLEKGVGKLQAAIFFCGLVALISGIATAMYALGMVQDNRMRLMVFGQFLAMLVAALLGSFQLIDGLTDLSHKRFSMNSLLVFTFVLCCIDGVLCLKQLRVPCCAVFSLQMTMSLWSAYQKRNATIGQMDTMRKAAHLDGIGIVPDYYEGTAGLLRGEAQVEDFMDYYDEPSKYEKVLSVYSVVALLLSIAAGVTAGVLHRSSSLGIQVAAIAALAAMPASMLITLSRPMAVLERRLHSLGAVLCGWRGVDGLSRKAVFPVKCEDLFPAGTVKLNGVKFYGSRESDAVVAYCAAVCSVEDSALKPLFNQLLESRNGIHFDVTSYRAYGNGGIGGVVNGEPVLVGNLSFLRNMGVDVPESIRVSNAVGVSVDGELSGLFAITYEKTKATAVGLATLCSYRRLRPILATGDFMLTEEFVRSKFGVNPRRVIFPKQEVRAELREQTLTEESPVLAISTGNGMTPLAYCVAGARTLKSACKMGMVIHMIGGILGIAIVLVLAVLRAQELLTPAHMFLYHLVWLVPGLLVTSWTRSI